MVWIHEAETEQPLWGDHIGVQALWHRNKRWIGLCWGTKRYAWFTAGRSVNKTITWEPVKQSQVLLMHNYPGFIDAYNMTNTIHVGSWRLWGQVCWRGTCWASNDCPTRILYNHTRLEGRERHRHYAWLGLRTKQVHLSMLAYIGKALTNFNHPTPTKQHSPYPSTPTKYGVKI